VREFTKAFLGHPVLALSLVNALRNVFIHPKTRPLSHYRTAKNSFPYKSSPHSMVLILWEPSFVFELAINRASNCSFVRLRSVGGIAFVATPLLRVNFCPRLTLGHSLGYGGLCLYCDPALTVRPGLCPVFGAAPLITVNLCFFPLIHALNTPLYFQPPRRPPAPTLI